MSQFERTGAIVAQSYHSYISDNVTLHNIGLASYTRNSLAKFGKEKRNGVERISPDINEYFGGSVPTGQLLGDSSTLYILKFDKDNKRYVERTSTGAKEDSIWWSASGDGAMAATSLEDFQKNFDLYQKGFLTDAEKAERIKEVWSNIQTSKSGCITFTATYNVLTCNQTSLVRIYFQSAGRSSTNRGVAQQVSQVWAGPPSMATGRKYAAGPTQSTGPGQYTGLLPGGNKNPQNVVAGNMRMNYDPATGQWESGTQQMMFRLLTDLEGVPLPDLPDDVDSTDIDDFYSGALSSAFNVGSGMAMSTEDGNPYLFGPNSMGCGPSPKEKVLMVNRTPRNYVKGEIVIASLINGEWIPMGFGLPSTVSKKLEVEWSQIQKYIVNANSFFRDMNNTRYITHQDYEGYLRTKFYHALSFSTETNALNNAKLNVFGIDESPNIISPDGSINLRQYSMNSDPNKALQDLVPSTGYLRSFDADLIRGDLGGNSDRDYLFRTNISKTPPDDLDYNLPYYANTAFNWGLFFREGYTRASVSRFKSNDGKSISSRGLIYVSEPKLSLNPGGLPTPMFDISDSNLYHMPAQIGLNSSTNPTFDFVDLWSIDAQKGYNFVTALRNYVGGGYKTNGSYLVDENGGNLYGLKPASSTAVQFSPLPLELALSDTSLPKNNILYFQNGYRSLQVQIEIIFRNLFNIPDYTSANNNILKGFWARNKLFVRRNLGDEVFSRIGLSSDKLVNVTNGKIEVPPFNEPKGGPNLIPPAGGVKEKSNIAGIIAVKATVNLVNGGTLSLDTSSYFGLKAYSVSTGGGGDFASTIIGGFISFVQDLTGQRSDRAVKQWGASEEKDPKSLGTTALFCKVYDHCPNTVLDGRYFVPIQLNPNNSTVDFEEPSLSAGSIITKTTNVTMATNACRRGMLLTGDGFRYIKKTIGINTSSLSLIEAGEDYSAGNILKFGGGKNPATLKLKNNGPLSSNINDYEIVSYGEYTGSTFDDALFGTISKGEAESIGTGGSIKITEGKVFESIKHDKLEYYEMTQLTPSSNGGVGDDGGYVHSAKNTSFSLTKNSTGKYDIFFFFVNDILHTLTGPDYPGNTSISNYVNLDISAN
jgi:hypothetical protein